MSVQRNVSGSQVRAQLTSARDTSGELPTRKRWKKLVLQGSGWLMSLSETRDLSLQDAGARLDTRVRSQSPAPPPLLPLPFPSLLPPHHHQQQQQQQQ